MEYSPRCLCPPLWLVGWEGLGGPCSSGRKGREKLVLLKLKSWSVLQDLLLDVGELIFALIPV